MCLNHVKHLDTSLYFFKVCYTNKTHYYVCVCVCVCVCVVGDRGLVINIQMYHDVSPRLGVCDLTEKSCSYLASALTSHSSSLTQLDLGRNKLLGDSGVELLCSALSHQNCKLEELQ